jgi:hypothetical protein
MPYEVHADSIAPIWEKPRMLHGPGSSMPVFGGVSLAEARYTALELVEDLTSTVV